MSIIITINTESKKRISGMVWEYDGINCQFKNYLEEKALSFITEKKKIKKMLESGNELYIEISTRCYAAIGNTIKEGCSYKPEGYYFCIKEEETGKTLEETLYKLEEKVKTVEKPKIKSKVPRSNITPKIKTL